MVAQDERYPFNTLRVVDFSMFMSGPYCTHILVELGATVIKVEPPVGDQLRYRAPVRSGISAYFGQFNAGKDSVTIDLKSSDGRESALRLMDAADVVVENFRPGVMQRLGLDYESVSKRNPRVIYCSISGYGQTGVNASLPAYAPIIQAASGFELATFRHQDSTSPAPVVLMIADGLAAATAFGAIMTALFRREHTNRGSYIDVALLDSLVALLGWETQASQHETSSIGVGYPPVKAADGLVMITPISERNFVSALTVIGQPELASDERFKDVANREIHWNELMQIIERWTREKPMAEVELRFREAGVPCSRYRSVSEVINDDKANGGNIFRRVSDGEGEYLIAGMPFRLSSHALAEVMRVQALGEANDRWLGESSPA
jgi:CoA:oxalate CoA-transferase